MIVTFYSFKGGVGRSMALANIARWLQLRGLNVVMVDWDLEAPGLETFFSDDGAVLRSWRDRVGLTDLLLLYRQDYPAIQLSADRTRQEAAGAMLQSSDPERPSVIAAPDPPRLLSPNERWDEIVADAATLRLRLPPLKFSLIDIPVSVKGAGNLRLLTAGWREGARFAHYANAVQSFDWNDFYASYHGHAYFEWLRTSLDDPEIADIVLIDSRTGVTEMGGVATRQLADVVVVLVAPNEQNIEGAIRMADSCNGAELLEQRGKRPIQVIMVPSRVDVSATKAKNEFEPMFEEKAKRFMPVALQKLGGAFAKLRIPYASEFAFRERLSVGEPDGDRDLNRAYGSIAAYAAWLADESNRAKAALVDDFLDVFGAERVRSALNFGAQFSERWQEIPEGLASDVKQLLIRLVELSVSVTETDRARPLLEEELQGAFRHAIDAAWTARLIKRGAVGSGGVSALQLAEPEYATRSMLATWVKDDREFLLWRQALRASLREWQTKGQDAGRLLHDSSLAEAKEMLGNAESNELLPDERAFIQTSIDAPQLPPPGAVEYATASAAAQAVSVATAEIVAPNVLPVAAPKRASRAWIVGIAAVVLAVAGLAIYLLRGGTRPVSTSNAAADSLLAGRQLAADSNYPGAIAAYTAVLRLDSLSVDARRYRAEAEAASGKPDRALLDLDTALTLAPNDLKLRAQRAQVLWSTRDAKAALADLDRVPGDSMDNATLRLRADVYSAVGQDSAALGAYTVVVQRGDSAAGQLGRGRALESLGRKTEAIQAYRAAARIATDPSITTFARTRLNVLAPQQVVIPVPPPARVSLQISSAADAYIAAAIDSSLQRERLRLERYSDGKSYQLTNVRTEAEIRYFSPSDESLANRVRGATEVALAGRGIYQKLIVRFASPRGQSSQAAQVPQGRQGQIIIVLPALYAASAK